MIDRVFVEHCLTTLVDRLSGADFAEVDVDAGALVGVGTEVSAVDVGALAGVGGEVRAVGVVGAADVLAVAVGGGGLGVVDFASSEVEEQLLNTTMADRIAAAPLALRTDVPTVLTNVISASISADRTTGV